MKIGDTVKIIRVRPFTEIRHLDGELGIYLGTTKYAYFYILKLKLTGEEINVNPELYKLEKVMQFKIGDAVQVISGPFDGGNELLGAIGEVYYCDDIYYGIAFTRKIEGKKNHLLEIDAYELLLFDKPLPVYNTDLQPTRNFLADSNDNGQVLVSDNVSGEVHFKSLFEKVFKMNKLKSNYKLIKLQKL